MAPMEFPFGISQKDIWHPVVNTTSCVVFDNRTNMKNLSGIPKPTSETFNTKRIVHDDSHMVLKKSFDPAKQLDEESQRCIVHL